MGWKPKQRASSGIMLESMRLANEQYVNQSASMQQRATRALRASVIRHDTSLTCGVTTQEDRELSAVSLGNSWAGKKPAMNGPVTPTTGTLIVSKSWGVKIGYCKMTSRTRKASTSIKQNACRIWMKIWDVNWRGRNDERWATNEGAEGERSRSAWEWESGGGGYGHWVWFWLGIESNVGGFLWEGKNFGPRSVPTQVSGKDRGLKIPSWGFAWYPMPPPLPQELSHALTQLSIQPKPSRTVPGTESRSNTFTTTPQ